MLKYEIIEKVKSLSNSKNNNEELNELFGHMLYLSVADAFECAKFIIKTQHLLFDRHVPNWGIFCKKFDKPEFWDRARPGAE